MTASLIMGKQMDFQLKTSFIPCTVLQMIRYDLDALQRDLVATLHRAPNFFLGSPIIIDLEKVQEQGPLDFTKIKEILLANNLIPMGVRHGSTKQLEAAATNGLPSITIGKLSYAEANVQKSIEQHAATKLITTPIRSGMQVYAKGADLIVLAPVSAGAELLADGHIHVYGPLRGRALAGVQGDVNARIFCRTLEAELVSIAGYYLTKEDMQLLPEGHGMIQVSLENEQVKIGKIS